MEFEQEEVEKKLGYHFHNPSLLQTAFTHSSKINELSSLESQDNEKLEFLGDRVLNLVVAEYLYENFPEEKEGVLSVRLAKLVEAASCYRYLENLDVKDYLIMGKGEATQTSSNKYSDLFEAILGAIFLDGGFAEAKAFFLGTGHNIVEQLMQEPLLDVKSILQSLCQKYLSTIPEYIVRREEGPDHEKTFHVDVLINEICLGFGLGKSKKEAQINAAKVALENCKKRGYFEDEI